MSQLSLFESTPVPPTEPVLHIPLNNLKPTTAVGQKPPASPNTIRYALEGAEAANQELIRLDARPYDRIWIIKLHNPEGAGGWKFWHRFASEAEAKAKLKELLDSGNYAEG